MRLLFIGDPHFRGNHQTKHLTSQILRYLHSSPAIDVIIVLGDILHTHDVINLFAFDEAIKFMSDLHSMCEKLVVVIGNHDRPNNRIFMTDEHPFNCMKLWEHTVVVDKVTEIKHKDMKILGVPYVYPGRFMEAVGDTDIKNYNLVIAHQEFDGCHLDPTYPTSGEKYPDDFPSCISGHVHQEEKIGMNLFYPGSMNNGGVFLFDKKFEKIDLKIQKIEKRMKEKHEKYTPIVFQKTTSFEMAFRSKASPEMKKWLDLFTGTS